MQNAKQTYCDMNQVVVSSDQQGMIESVMMDEDTLTIGDQNESENDQHEESIEEVSKLYWCV